MQLEGINNTLKEIKQEFKQESPSKVLSPNYNSSNTPVKSPTQITNFKSMYTYVEESDAERDFRRKSNIDLVCIIQNERLRLKDTENNLKSAEFEIATLKQRNEELIDEKAHNLAHQAMTETKLRQEMQIILEVNNQHEMNLHNTRAKIEEMDRTVNKL